jgi:predicted dehydrogenase
MVKAEPPVRIGLVGAGAVAQVSHLPALARIPDAQVTALCDLDLPKARRVASRYNIARVTDSFEELAGLDDVDAVDICLPNHLHAPAGLAALEAGKHVLCERPFTRTSEEAERLVAAARRRKRVLMAGYNNRFREDVVVLKRFIAGGEVGKIFYTKAGWLMRPSSWTGSGWRKQKRYSGGGVLLDLGAQMLDLALWVLDLPKVEWVSASLHPAPRKDVVESTASAFLRLGDGGVVTLEVSWGLLMQKDFAYLNVFGDQGAALLNPIRLHKEMHGSLVNVTPTLSTTRQAYRVSYENEIRHFVQCVQTGARPMASGEDAVALLRILEAMTRSALEGGGVPVGA